MFYELYIYLLLMISSLLLFAKAEELAKLRMETHMNWVWLLTSPHQEIQECAFTAAHSCGLYFLTICWPRCATSCMQSFFFTENIFACPISWIWNEFTIIRCFLMQVEPYEDSQYIQGAVNMVLRLRWDGRFLQIFSSSVVTWDIS